MKNKIITSVMVIGITTFTLFGRTAEEILSLLHNSIHTDEIIRNITQEEWAKLFDKELASVTTNKIQSMSALSIKGFGLMFVVNKKLTDEYDEKFFNKGFYCEHLNRYYITPKCVNLYIDSNINTNAYKTLMCQLVKKYKIGTQHIHKFATLPEYINSFALCFANGQAQGIRVEHWKQRSLVIAEKQMKRVMREQGKSFVSDGKTNPFQDEIDALTTALNAPKLAGLKEWVAKWFPSYNWKEINFKTDEEIQQIKDDIFYGEKPFSNESKVLLQIHLGLEKCNEFITQYNGDQK